MNDNPENSFTDGGDDFEPLPDTFSPLRIAFIVTGFSASASELMINGLDPHIDVALVGIRDCGESA